MTSQPLELTLQQKNPLTIKDYCYYDGTVTSWHRNPQLEIVKDRILYVCLECESERKYNALEDKRGR